MFNPFGVGGVVLRAYPGCAARPRALLLDCFAVRRTMPTNPSGVQHGGMFNPFGVVGVVLRAYLGCAARPRALLLDRFTVTLSEPTI
jgi:hypothetical protein